MNKSHTKHLLKLVLGSLLGVTTITAQANSEWMDLLEVLKNNHTTTQAQYERLRDEAMNREAGANKNSKKKRHIPAEVETEGGLKVESADGNFEFELGGELWFDAADYQEDVEPLGNGTELRRARVSFSGKLFKDWLYASHS